MVYGELVAAIRHLSSCKQRNAEKIGTADIFKSPAGVRLLNKVSVSLPGPQLGHLDTTMDVI